MLYVALLTLTGYDAESTELKVKSCVQTALFRRIHPDPIDSVLDSRLRDRPFLIDASEDYFPDHVSSVDRDFPGFFKARDDMNDMGLEEVARSVRSFIDAELTTYGCLVLRGLPLSNAGSFSQLLHAMGYNVTRYIGGVTHRSEEAPMVYPASSEDCEVSMDLHQDNTYWPVQPEKLFFFYEQPAAAGGLNPVLDMYRYIKSVPPEIVDKFERLQIQYHNFYPDASSDDRFVPWQQSFNTTHKQTVENILRQGGFSFAWTDRGLRKWNTLPPFKRHPKTGEMIWSNMIVSNHASYFHSHPTFPEMVGVPFVSETAGSDFQYPFTMKYGDGSEIEYGVIQTLRRLAWQQARGFKPLQGDLLIVDNYLTQHARLSYTPPRKFWIGISLD